MNAGTRSSVCPTIRDFFRRRTAFTGILLLVAASAVSPAWAVTYYATYKLSGGTATKSNQTYSASATDTSGVWATSSGNLTLNSCTIATTGNSSNVNTSSQYGLNAGVLATAAGKITMAGGSVTTSGSGANGLFATGTGSSISMSNGTVTATGSGGHGVDVTYGGSITLTNVNVSSSGANSSALATDFGGGTVTVTGGTIIAACTAANGHSAGIYSTGVITVADAAVASYGDCGGVIDGANSISLKNTSLTGALEGFKVWKTAAASGAATITLDGGSLTATSGSGFYVTGSTGNAATASLTVKGGATISAGTGRILNVDSSSTVSFTADGVTLDGDLYADSTSTITATLQNAATLAGMANRAAITVDSTSVWTAATDSTLTSLTNSGTVGFEKSSIVDTISGNFTQASTGTLGILLGGESSYNQLAVSGTATLDGSLEVNLADGFAPTAGQTFDILDWSVISGTFDEVLLPELTDNLEWNSDALYTSGELAVVAASRIPGDANGNGAVDETDAAALAAHWGESGEWADGDFNDDGLVNATDAAILAANWTGGDNEAAGVPEPGAVAMIALGIAGFLVHVRHRRRS